MFGLDFKFYGMKKNLILFIALLGWFAVVVQFFLMLENKATSLGEMIIRFFSFFTILTNILVALYFTALALRVRFLENKGASTAVTIYIFIVGLIYQLVLRKTWQPEGIQMVVNELLHSVIPVLAVVFWVAFDAKKAKYDQIPGWSIYPLIYLLFILVRGSFSAFYPYPFVDVNSIGMQDTLKNALLILLLFLLLSFAFVFVGRRLANVRAVKGNKI